MFSMTAAEFSLYLGVIIVVSMLGLAFWVWTQIRDLQLNFKTLDMTTIKLSERVREYSGTGTTSGPPQQPPQLQTQTQNVDSPENVEDTDDIIEEEVEFDDDNTKVEESHQVSDVSNNINDIMNDICDINENTENTEDNEDNEVIKETPIELTTDYTNMKIGELRRIAEEKNIHGYKHLKKNELIEALNA